MCDQLECLVNGSTSSDQTNQGKSVEEFVTAALVIYCIKAYTTLSGLKSSVPRDPTAALAQSMRRLERSRRRLFDMEFLYATG